MLQEENKTTSMGLHLHTLIRLRKHKKYGESDEDALIHVLDAAEGRV